MKTEIGTVDVIIPVYKPGKEFLGLIDKLLGQTVPPDHILIMQTLEEGEPPLDAAQIRAACGCPFPGDGDKKGIEESQIQVFPVRKAEFDHGGTRDRGAKQSLADYILFMTQDAVPADERLIENLLQGFAGEASSERIGIAYGRQLAREGADILEKMARLHNYPAEGRIQTKADVERLGIKAYFCSDVCAMYDRKLYEELGGFVHPTIFNEDMIMAFRVIQAGYGVCYAADARVVHSHSYTCMQQFHRNFDLGVSQTQYREVFEQISSEKEGAGFAKNTLIALCRKMRFFKAFYFALNCAFRLAGYKLGRNYPRLSKKMILRCTMSPGYWRDYRG